MTGADRMEIASAAAVPQARRAVLPRRRGRARPDPPHPGRFLRGNENDRAQARQFIGMLRGLAIRHECAVLLLSHPSVAGIASGGGSSGSTAWNNSVRSRLYLSRVVGNDGFEANPDARGN
jgi:hypothetical protein